MKRRRRRGLGASPQEHRSHMGAMIRETQRFAEKTMKATSCGLAIRELEVTAEYHGRALAHAGHRSQGDMTKDLARLDNLNVTVGEARAHVMRVCGVGRSRTRKRR